jgi:hypothetical protein
VISELLSLSNTANARAAETGVQTSELPSET